MPLARSAHGFDRSAQLWARSALALARSADGDASLGMARAVSLTFVGSLLLKETVHIRIWDDFNAEGGSDHYDETQRALALEAEAERRPTSR